MKPNELQVACDKAISQQIDALVKLDILASRVRSFCEAHPGEDWPDWSLCHQKAGEIAQLLAETGIASTRINQASKAWGELHRTYPPATFLETIQRKQDGFPYKENEE